MKKTKSKKKFSISYNKKIFCDLTCNMKKNYDLEIFFEKEVPLCLNIILSKDNASEKSELFISFMPME